MIADKVDKKESIPMQTFSGLNDNQVPKYKAYISIKKIPHVVIQNWRDVISNIKFSKFIFNGQKNWIWCTFW